MDSSIIIKPEVKFHMVIAGYLDLAFKLSKKFFQRIPLKTWFEIR